MEVLERLKKIHGFQPGGGYVETNLEAVHFFWSTKPIPRAPLVYNAGLVLVLQGQKIGYLEDRVFCYNADHYLVLSIPVPFECETQASPDNPIVGIFIDISRTELFELIKLLDFKATLPAKATSIGVAPAPLFAEMKDAIKRLLHAMCTESESLALGPGILREILYHALHGPHGSSLRALAQIDSHSERVSRTIRIMRENYSEFMSIEKLAAEAGMSTPVFHRAFRKMTGSTPLQYLKAIRLNNAKGLIVANGIPVNKAAQRVGYESTEHFSREFKKHFGVSPRNAKDAGYMRVDV